MRGQVPIAVAALLLGLCNAPEADSRRPRRHANAAVREPRSGSIETRVIDLASSAVGPQRVVVMLPAERTADAHLPLLVALHGQGEARRGVRRGAHGWLRDYDLDRADAALRRGRLTVDDFRGFVEPDRLRVLNESLRTRPYRGLVVACPYTNDLFADPGVVEPFDRFVVAELLARLRRDLPVSSERAATGIDGVSLGGVLALLVGLGHPETFGVVGGLQPAVRRFFPELLSRARLGGAARPSQRIRLVTSQGDHFRESVHALSRELTAAAVTHELLVTPGPHDYVWNRGPGAVEMLLWHDRALRGEAP